MSYRHALLVTAGASLLLGASAQAATYNLAGSVGATPTFSIASGGVTATFSSPSGNQFQVQSMTGLLSFSTALLDSNFFGSDPLTISFSAPIYNQISIPFAILDSNGLNGNDGLTVTTSNGRVLSYGTRLDGLALNEPEGTINFVPAANGLTSLTIASQNSNNAFAIGNVTVPEPMSLSLLGVGLAGLAAVRRRA